MDSPERLEKPRRRWLRRGVVGLLLFELVYVVAFEAAARSGRLERWINRRPEKIVISFEAAHSFLPFWVMASGIELRGQTPTLRWRAAVDRGQALISPFGLGRRTIRVPWARAVGGTFQAQRESERAIEPPRASIPRSSLPAIAALPQPATPRPPSARPKWSFELPDIDARGFRELWFDAYRLVGVVDFHGGAALYAGRELEVAPSRVELSNLRALIGEAEIGRGLGGGVDLRVARYLFKEHRGLAALKFVSASADLRGELAERELLGLFLSRAPWLSVGESLGALTAHLEVESGRLRPGTKVEFRHPGLETTVFDFQATGDAKIDFEVVAAEGSVNGARAGLEVHYDDFEVRSGAATQPEFVGTGLTIVATTPDLELASVTKAARVQIDLGHARIPDLSVYNSWIPPGSGLVLVGGGGALTGTFDADLAANSAQGRFKATIDAAAVRYQDLELAGGVSVELAIPSADLARRTFDLTATRFELTDFRSPQAAAAGPQGAPAGWWARFELAEGSLTLPPAARASARFEVTLRDSVPLVGLFETRKTLPRWIERLLTVQDIRAGGALAWSPTELALEELSTRFRSADIRARLRFAGGSKRGVLMVVWHRLALGVRVDDERKKFKLVGVKKWFESADLGGTPSSIEGGTLEDDPFSEEALRSAELPGLGAEPDLEDGDAAVSGSDGTAPADGFFEVVAGALARGNLDGDAEQEAAMLLAVPAADAPRALHVVALDLVDGRASSLGGRELLPGAQLRALGIEGDTIVAEALIAGEGGEACCPDRKRTLRWRATNGELEELGSEEGGPFAAADLAGGRWRLVAEKPGERTPAPSAGSLSFGDSSFVLEIDCSRQAGGFVLGTGLVLVPGPLERSALECAAPESDALAGLFGEAGESCRLSFTPGRMRIECGAEAGKRAHWFEREPARPASAPAANAR